MKLHPEAIKYDIAKEEGRWEQRFVVEKTNCTDKVGGHKWDWVEDRVIRDEIFRQHPRFYKGIPIVKCYKCNKVKQSM